MTPSTHAEMAIHLCERAAELRRGSHANDLTVAHVLEEMAAVLRRSTVNDLATCPVCGLYLAGLSMCRKDACPNPGLRKAVKR